MKQKYDQLASYVLHARPFRETSLLLDLFTEKLGRYSAIARGASRGKSPSRILLQPFNFLRVSLQGHDELLNLTQIERSGIPCFLSGQTAVCGLYLNELLYSLLPRHDPHPALFQAYHLSLLQLAAGREARIVLRQFEFILLEELGYGIYFSSLEANQYYYYDPRNGFQQLADFHKKDSYCFSGDVLLAVAAEHWQHPEAIRTAKRLTYLALAPLLAGKIIRTRELLI